MKQILSMLKGFAPEGVELKESTDFVMDLDFDSVQVMEFLPEVEDSFDIIIPLHMVEEVSNIADLANLVLKLQDED